jgi:hypothetical protein
VYADPALFASLPETGVSRLQDLLLVPAPRVPCGTPWPAARQSIAAFASLHVSIFFTGAVAAHLRGLGRRVRIARGSLLGADGRGATSFLGWHTSSTTSVVSSRGARAPARPDASRASTCAPSAAGPRPPPAARVSTRAVVARWRGTIAAVRFVAALTASPR